MLTTMWLLISLETPVTIRCKFYFHEIRAKKRFINYSALKISPKLTVIAITVSLISCNCFSSEVDVFDDDVRQ